MSKWPNFVLYLLSLFLLSHDYLAQKPFSEWEQTVRHQIMLSEYFSRVTNEGYEFTNRAKNLRAKISTNKFSFSPRQNPKEGDWKISYELSGFGKKGNLILPKNYQAIKKNQHLTFSSSDLDIYFLNSPAGIRQDFIVKNKPMD